MSQTCNLHVSPIRIKIGQPKMFFFAFAIFPNSNRADMVQLKVQTERPSKFMRFCLFISTILTTSEQFLLTHQKICLQRETDSPDNFCTQTALHFAENLISPRPCSFSVTDHLRAAVLRNSGRCLTNAFQNVKILAFWGFLSL
jgi:hypothetical protein